MASFGDELLCFHGPFSDQFEGDEEEEVPHDDDDDDQGFKSCFRVSFLNTKTFKVNRTAKIKVDEKFRFESNVFDQDGSDPIYTRMTVSPGRRYLAVTLGHEDYSAVVFVDLSEMAVAAIKEAVNQHDQMRVVFLSDTVALLSSQQLWTRVLSHGRNLMFCPRYHRKI